jgi:hypothetical protein
MMTANGAVAVMFMPSITRTAPRKFEMRPGWGAEENMLIPGRLSVMKPDTPSRIGTCWPGRARSLKGVPRQSVVIAIVIFIRQCLGYPGLPHSCHKSLDFVGAHGNSLYGARR